MLRSIPGSGPVVLAKIRAFVEWERRFLPDDDGDLDVVTTELLDSDQNVLDSAGSNVSDSNASGSHEVRTRSSDSDVVKLAVTDAAGIHTNLRSRTRVSVGPSPPQIDRAERSSDDHRPTERDTPSMSHREGIYS